MSGRSSCLAKPDCIAQGRRRGAVQRRDGRAEQVEGEHQIVVALLPLLAPDLDAEDAGRTELRRLVPQTPGRAKASVAEALRVVLVLLVGIRAARGPEPCELRAETGDDVDDARPADQAERPTAGLDQLPEVAAAQANERDRLVLGGS